MKRCITGMLMKRKELEAWIDNHTFQVMVALAQLYQFHDGSRTHWRREVWEKFSRIYKLKRNNKLPSARFIFNSSWELNHQNVGRALQYAMDKESDYTVQDYANFDEFYQIVQDYFYWLSDQLSRAETLKLDDVKAELDRLGLTEIVDY